MGMSIDEAGNIIDRYDVNFYDDDGHKIDVGVLAQAFDTALETMRKYRKIEQILDDCLLDDWEILKSIREVVEDGRN